MDDSDNMQVDLPTSLIPNLAEWGIDEVDTGVCEDTFENRRAIRDNNATWLPVYGPNGEPTTHIQVVTAEMRTQHLTSNKYLILSSPTDPDSPYLTEENLLDQPDTNRIVPGWVIAATRRWLEVAEKRKENPTYRPALLSAPGRCKAIRVDGHRCAAWHGGRKDEGGYCRMHIANRPGEVGIQVAAKAKHQVQSATVAAVTELEKLLLTASSEDTRLRAAKEILDRGGVRGGIEIDQKTEINVIPSEDLVRDRLEKLKKNQLEVQARLAAHSQRQEDAAEAARQPRAWEKKEIEPSPEAELVAEVIEDES